ncbi:unnamed protein product [Parnassius mnemosyne]|uniref:Uncharacterized protein n=1 Tax=Parnassius mnemosyne TaxID=213953 RepID=A0AAV1KCJ0_9NEOP
MGTKELNILELSDHLKPDQRTDEPVLKHMRQNINQKEEESQKLQTKDLKLADASDNIHIVETLLKRSLRIKIS